MRKVLMIAGVSLLIVANANIVAKAEGWQKSGNQWIYVDDNNNRMYNVWKKGADDKWRYIAEDGTMAVNRWVDDEYYVDGQGLITSNGFLLINNNWYYFDRNGKKVVDKWQQVNGKWYYLNEEGLLLKGWILEDRYYIGDDGAMVTGWQYLLPPDSYSSKKKNEPFSNTSSTDGKKWFYFGNNGKRYTAKDEFSEKIIDGKRYAFNENGELCTGWVKISDRSNSEISNYRLYSEKGEVVTGWYSSTPPDDLASNYNNDVEWFYFDSKGAPKAAKSDKLLVSDFVKINGRSYLFNSNGTPVHGLQKVYDGVNSNDFDLYYFGEENQCYVQKGKISVLEGNGDRVPYYFSDVNGKGYTGVKSGLLYYKGRLQRADRDSRYSVISIPNGSSTLNYVINSSGKIFKNATLKDSDQVTYKTSSTGILSEIDGRKDNTNGEFEAPQTGDILID